MSFLFTAAGFALKHGRLIAMIASVLVGVLGIGGATIHKHRAHEAQAAAQAARAALAASEDARKTEQAHHDRVVAALEDRAARAEARNAEDDNTRKEINRAKPTNVCSTSPAIRSMLDGMRKPQPRKPARPARPH